LKRALIALAALLAVTVATLVALTFPYDVDVPASAKDLADARQYYAEAYKAPATEEPGTSAYETRYIQLAKEAAGLAHIQEQVQDFVNRFSLRKRPVLEMGSGRGYLQDVAEDYTGLDISSSVSRFYHKKFVLASATAMPFPDSRFDGAWSIWVLEHIPRPEHALREIRRVVRDGGVILLYPAWNCPSWNAGGYGERPYSDFSLAGKVIKASIPVRSSLLFRAMCRIPARSLRALAASFGGPTTLHYRRLTPNYQTYWGTDADAVSSIDKHEVALWFHSRGDECSSCPGPVGTIFMKGGALIIRVHK
jgi:SAM-dependent methyltransferase